MDFTHYQHRWHGHAFAQLSPFHSLAIIHYLIKSNQCNENARLPILSC